MRISRFNLPTTDNTRQRDRWLVTYANFITLLFAMFLVLYAISYFNEKKLSTFVTTLSASQKLTINPLDSDQLTQALDKITLLQQQTLDSGKATTTQMEEASGDNSVSEGGIETATPDETTQQLLSYGDTRKKSERVEIELSSNFLFKGGSADLTQQAKKSLQKLSVPLNTIPNPLEIEGYTDAIPINTKRYPSNWELSAARAASVTREFIKNGINPKRLVAVGYGEFRPRADTESTKNEALNRRVLVVIRADQSSLPPSLKQILQGI